MTPLHFCVGFIDHKGPNPKLPLFKLLSYISRLDVNEADSFGRTALQLIDSDTPVSFVTALVNAGASTEVLDTRGSTPLAKAIKSGNVEVFEYLKTKDQNTSDGRNAICPVRLACAAGNAAMVEHLVYSSADVDEVDRSTGETPLYALFTGPGASSDLVRFLVDDCGADVNRPRGEFKYPLIKAFTCYIEKHWTSEDRRRLVLKIYSNIRLLLRRGADIDAEDDSGRRAVHLALLSLSLTVPWHLSEEFSADLSARDNLGRSALHYAAALGLPSDFDRLAERTGANQRGGFPRLDPSLLGDAAAAARQLQPHGRGLEAARGRPVGQGDRQLWSLDATEVGTLPGLLHGSFAAHVDTKEDQETGKTSHRR
ncbi:hypothetical protein PG988_007731 [Apiospora saccharicola]